MLVELDFGFQNRAVVELDLGFHGAAGLSSHGAVVLFSNRIVC